MLAVPEDCSSTTAILAVDDTPANLVALSALVDTLGVQCVTAPSGAVALELAAQQDFAVILLDVMMPELDGLATLERLRTLPRARYTPVIFLTAHDQDRAVVQRAYALGAVDYVAKPIDGNILRAKLRAFIALHEQAQAIRQQAEALAAKDRYIGILAHDLGNPVAAIRMVVERMRKHPDQAVRSMGERIERSARRMEHLIDDVLGFARIASGHIALKRSSLDLGQLCRNVVDEFAEMHPGVRFSVDPCEAVAGSWDRERLQQALTNLLSNAVKYGDGWVTATMTQANGAVVVEVENGGEPISEECRARLFEPFERGTHEQRGLGLGLYIVREIARAHEGSVELVAKPASTCFRLSLPRAPAQ